MTTVLNCIAYEHNPVLVLVAALVCVAGVWTMPALHVAMREG